MLTKLLSVSNVGRLAECVPKGDVAFKRFTVLYAENGSGKSTLAAILRSMRTNDPKIVSGRKTFGAAVDPVVQFLVQGKQVKFSNGKWSAPVPEIEVLDQEFVHANVHSGPALEHEHRRQLYEFALGETGVNLAQEVARLAREITEAQKVKREAKLVVDAHTKGDMEADAFVALKPIGDVAGALETARQELKTVQQVEKVKTAPKLPSVRGFAVNEAAVAAVLGSSIETLADDAEERVREHLRAHDQETRQESWLAEGLEFIAAEKCPFCAQELAGSVLIGAMRTFFSEGYQRLKKDLSAHSQRLQGELAKFPAALSLDGGSLEKQEVFWREYLPNEEFPRVDRDGIAEFVSNFATLFSELFETKLASPVESLADDPRLATALASVEAARALIAECNTRIDTYNDKIESLKLGLQAKDVAELKRHVRELELHLVRAEAVADAACKNYEESSKSLTELEAQKVKAKSALDTHAEALMPTYQGAINKLLERFGASFQIVKAKTSYVGGKPSAAYFIKIGQGEFDPSAKGESVPNFGNTLSEGDKRTLAFAFFVARLQADAALSSKVLVFDDPMTSLDANRRHCTMAVIGELAADAEQCIVMSHDPLFLFGLVERCRAFEHRELKLMSDGAKTLLVPWDAAEETLSDYLKDFRGLRDFAGGAPAGDLRALARRLRVLLEGNLRFRFPDAIGPKQWLGDFVGAALAAGPGSPLLAVAPDLKELEEVKNYCSRYHHSNPQHETELITEAELRTYASKTLKLIQR